MKSIEAYIIKTAHTFFDFKNDADKARLVMLGFPYDSTSSFRVGSRFAPSELRFYSSAIEGYSWETGLEISELNVADVGDIAVVHGNTELSLERLRKVIEELRSKGKKIGVIGGEHTLTLSSASTCGAKSIVIFDAHLDLRNEFPYGQKLSHATWLKRLIESLRQSGMSIAVIGVRATSKEELENAKKHQLNYITLREYESLGVKVVDDLLSTMSKPIYVSIDVDVLDPAYAPGVSNPEPLGLTLNELLKLLWRLRDTNIAGFDVVEVCPPYDNGVTCISACKIIMDMLFLSLL